jgi:hypothetical protein
MTDLVEVCSECPECRRLVEDAEAVPVALHSQSGAYFEGCPDCHCWLRRRYVPWGSPEAEEQLKRLVDKQ